MESIAMNQSLLRNWDDYHQDFPSQLLGDKLTARSFSSQVSEIHARVAVLNKFTELDRPHTQVVTWIWLN